MINDGGTHTLSWRQKFCIEVWGLIWLNGVRLGRFTTCFRNLHIRSQNSHTVKSKSTLCFTSKDIWWLFSLTCWRQVRYQQSQITVYKNLNIFGTAESFLVYHSLARIFESSKLKFCFNVLFQLQLNSVVATAIFVLYNRDSLKPR